MDTQKKNYGKECASQTEETKTQSTTKTDATNTELNTQKELSMRYTRQTNIV